MWIIEVQNYYDFFFYYFGIISYYYYLYYILVVHEQNIITLSGGAFTLAPDETPVLLWWPATDYTQILTITHTLISKCTY